MVFIHILVFLYCIKFDIYSSVMASSVHLAFKIFEASSGADESLSPVIFLHGLTAVKEDWGDIPQIIAERTKRKAYAYDARNHGDSDYSNDAFGFGVDRNVDDLFYLMDTLNIPKAVLIGHSAGGMTANFAALKNPKRVEKLFAEDIHLKKPTQEEMNVGLPLSILRVESFENLPPGLDEEEATKLSNDYIFSRLPEDSPFHKSKDDMYKEKLWLMRGSDGRLRMNCNIKSIIQGLKNVDSLMNEPKGQYDGPAYFIYGDKSPVSVGTQKENIRKHFPRVEFIELKTRFHNIHQVLKDEFVEAVLKRLYIPIKISYKSYEPSKIDRKLSPIIFIHGVTDSKETWNDIFEIIAEKSKRKVYAYDCRNHGESEYTDAFSFDLNVDDLFYFMDTMDISQAILVGHSMGSFTSTNAALRKPERIEKIFSEDMYVKKLPKNICDQVVEWISGWSESIKAIPQNTDESEVANVAIDYLTHKFPSSLFNEESLRKTKFVFKRTSNDGFDLNFNEDVILQAMKNADNLMTEPCGQFDGPAFFIYGSLSPFNVGSEKENIQKYFSKAEFIEFEGATHDVHVEFPEKYVKTILDLL